jgi:maltose alpha-D-glucosyltransferase / alpha-amylase
MTGRGARSGLDPFWYKDAIVYEVHVRAFHDSNGDGIGDFPGLTQKLDYIRDLGVTAIWLLPFYPSPLKDDGYDISDYYSINPIYGTLKDFKTFLQEAHKRQLRVITELVVNHTSEQHPWFARSRRAKPGSIFRDYYVWTENPEKYKEARIIFRDFEHSNWTWDPVGNAYFWHRFYGHQPDLNYDHPPVRKEIKRVLDFWLDLGVDGLRLDAVPYLYEREGTSCENLPETHAYLKTLRAHVEERYGDRMLLAEANQWPEDAVSYFGGGKGDECHMAFHFPLMPRIFMAVRMEDRVPIVDILEQTPAIPETSQWALFLRNHDELTLEMVTDEERDYMYRVYASQAKARINLGIRRRLAPLLGNDRKRIELVHLLLLSFPGTPVLYYGDEIGMGDNVFLGDRNGVRTPMQWSSDKNAGFSRASPQALYLPIILDPEYHYEAINVEAQQSNPNSLWWWMKRVLTLRQRHRAFGRGTIQFLRPENRKILAFTRRSGDEVILVVANLSRFPQPVQLDLNEFKQMKLIELFGRTDFPPITEQPYSLTLSPHAAFWFLVEKLGSTATTEPEARILSVIAVGRDWTDILHTRSHSALERCLASFLLEQPWFNTSRRLKGVQVRDHVRVPAGSATVILTLVLVEFTEGDPEEYLVPLAFAGGEEAESLMQSFPRLTLARLRIESIGAEGILYDACAHSQFAKFLCEALPRRRVFNDGTAQFRSFATDYARNGACERAIAPLESTLNHGLHSNTTFAIGDKYFLKLFRRLEPGINPDLETSRFLNEKGFLNVPKLAGWADLEAASGERLTAAVLAEYIPNAKIAWEFTLDALGRYFERLGLALEHLKSAAESQAPGSRHAVSSDTLACEHPAGSLLDLAAREPPPNAAALIGTFLESARLLGKRMAELHLALASDGANPDFAPEPFTPFYQRSLFQSMRNFAVEELRNLRRALPLLKPDVRPDAEKVLAAEPAILDLLRRVHAHPIAARRIRCHEDLHLGEVLYTGKDFVFIDFEGAPRRSIGERRIKRSPLRDVSSMIRSFDYASHIALVRQIEQGRIQEQRAAEWEPWTSFWHGWVSAAFLKSYFDAIAAQPGLYPKSAPDMAALLEAHLLAKALDEVGYELRYQPERLKIPIRAVLRLVG